MTLTATNTQWLQGSGVDALNALKDAADAEDVPAILAAADAAITAASDLQAFVQTLPSTTERTFLATQAGALAQALSDYADELAALEQTRIETLETLAELYAYEPEVSFSAGANLLAVQASRAGYPSVVRVGGQWRMMFAYKRNLFAATSADGASWSVNLSTPALRHKTVTWDQSELFSPSLNCNDAPGVDRHVAFYGGRETETNVPGDDVVVAGFGDGLSPDFGTWLSATEAMAEWNDSLQWRHWDMLRAGNVWRVWMSERDGSGKLVIRAGSSGPVTVNGGTGRVCD